MSDQVRSFLLRSAALAPWIVSVGIGWTMRVGLIQDRESNSFFRGSDDSGCDVDAECGR
jgi:hypothetical protein